MGKVHKIHEVKHFNMVNIGYGKEKD